MAVLLAKMLTLVAPTSMTEDQQELWLRAAIDALQDIRVSEVHAVILELQRSVTRPNQIVPEICKLVGAKRSRSNTSAKPASPFFAEREISRKAQEMRAQARTQRAVEDAWAWERSARADVGLAVPPIERPLAAWEIEAMPAHVRRMGLASGFLKAEGDRIVEVNDPDETDRIREHNRRGR